MYLEVIAVLHYNKHDDVIPVYVSKLVFHQSKCICAIKRILSTTAMYVSSSSFMYLRIPCYCDACLNSSALRVGVKTLLNTIQDASVDNISIAVVSLLAQCTKYCVTYRK